MTPLADLRCRLGTGASRVLLAAAIALATHAALYGAWDPNDAGHAYFGWYAPLVALAGAASAGALTALLGAAALSRRMPSLQTTLRGLLPGAEPPAPLGRRLWLLSLGWLAVQETAEESIVHRGLTLPLLDARQLALILLVSGLCALLAARALGSSLRLVRRLLARAPAPLARPRPARPGRLPEAPLAWALVWLVDAAGRRGPPLAA
jgi:hypothetical protein